MKQTTLEEIFTSPWGILSDRRAEVECGSYGIHDRIKQEEIDKRFRSIDAVAEAMACHRDTATKRLKGTDVRYIEGPHQKRLFFVDDVQPVIDLHVAERNAKKAGAA